MKIRLTEDSWSELTDCRMVVVYVDGVRVDFDFFSREQMRGIDFAEAGCCAYKASFVYSSYDRRKDAEVDAWLQYFDAKKLAMVLRDMMLSDSPSLPAAPPNRARL